MTLYNWVNQELNNEGFFNALIWIVFLTLFSYLSRELEIWRMINEIKGYLQVFESVRNKAFKVTVDSFKEKALVDGKYSIDLKVLEKKISDFLDMTFMSPIELDPFGVVAKLKHLVITSDETMSNEISLLLPDVREEEVENLKNLVEASRALNLIYKILDHVYRLGRKFKSMWLLMQLNAQLPLLTEEVKALENTLEAFKRRFPLGDGAGALVAAKFIRSYGDLDRVEEVAKNTIVARTSFEDRDIIVVKGKGPAGVLGRLDDALDQVISESGEVSMIISVDAALKLEGEKTGLISQGFGVAMGGLGYERFNIEKKATEMKIPLYGILIKMSLSDALSTMLKEVSQAVDEALDSVKQIIRTRGAPGKSVIILGVGNTLGVTP